MFADLQRVRNERKISREFIFFGTDGGMTPVALVSKNAILLCIVTSLHQTLTTIAQRKATAAHLPGIYQEILQC